MHYIGSRKVQYIHCMVHRWVRETEEVYEIAKETVKSLKLK